MNEQEIKAPPEAVVRSYVVIRRLDPSELPGCLEQLRELTIAPTSDMANFLRCIPDRAPWMVSVAEAGGGIVGWSLIQSMGPRRRRTLDVFVHPKRRRSGFGRRLADLMLQWNEEEQGEIPLVDDSTSTFYDQYKSRVRPLYECRQPGFFG